MLKIKLNDKHDGNFKFYVCETNDGKPFTASEAERLYNDIRADGKSVYHQMNGERGYRIRVIQLDDYYYVTIAILNDHGSEDITIQELESKHQNDALAISKFFRRNWDKLIQMGRDQLVDQLKAEYAEAHEA